MEATAYPISDRRRASGRAIAFPLIACHALLAGLGAPPDASRAGDWPQFLGPSRNNRADDDELPPRFPPSTAARLSYAVGAGYAGPAVVGDRILLFHRDGDTERLEAIDRATGTSVWKADAPTAYQGGYNADTGPRCVPTAADGRVFAFGADGRLRCVSLADGTVHWQRDLARELQSPEGYFGVGSSPLVVGPRVLVHVGGRSGAGIVALDVTNGETVWSRTEDPVSYASPILADRGGQPTALFLSRYALFGIDPADGTIAFTHAFGKRGLTVTGASPIVLDDRVFLSASYQIGAECLRIRADGAPERIWGGDSILSSQYANAVFHQGYLFGTHGREDGPPSELRCVDAATGNVAWRRPDAGVCHIIAAGDRLLVVEVQHGDIVLVSANPQRYEELDRRHLAEESLRPLPALANGELLLRTHTDQNTGRLLIVPLR